ncbi:MULTISPECIES: anthranilate synthase component II [Proteiniphilum]|uniref:anthranilate synthase component II n=1 Tax=Proteiniphilum TaxID=294702 RepID=UPI00035C270C|nr:MULTISPECIES: aminodeoxychorismate/anthranilate synthase component II [Proteiniphilum]MDY9920106.1 aminodeoxychorismate/anthranilate synthase component II [Proteiniphilum sp.]SDZ72754.1 anthranilate synthase, component II [Porphyromonadaceae bacterium KH3R12]SFL49986.1 anthranilate synthase, component II [Porphyromonadaceae bacterium KH3CP3RA]SFS73834.1 anthranilate synthase, component II [Porphyromonadaceae bacterium NLAE-zl-C104]
MSKILILDNYDSFTYNLLHAVKSLGYNDVDVVRNDKIDLSSVAQYDKIILSPGPGIPEEAGLLLPLIEQYAETKSILGVCLGHQAIGVVFGATLENIPFVFHGVQTRAKITGNDYLFHGLPEEILVGRYHSWIVSGENFPPELEITALDEAGSIMAMKHKRLDLHGVQFHPESILTPEGIHIIRNFIGS